MAITLYERQGHEGRRPSPYALAHKGLEATFVGMRFAQADEVRALSGQTLVPVLVDGETVVPDSWAITEHLERAYPDRPSLFGGDAGHVLARFVNAWTDESLNPTVRALIYPDFIACIDEGDRDYFRRAREASLGRKLEEFSSDRQRQQETLAGTLSPLRKVLEKSQFFCGSAPAYADYVVFSAFQWARLGCPRDILPLQDSLRLWRERMISLYDRMADLFPGYPGRA
jgi:glutathione S-transferase